jgi:hypothetical protein
MSGHTVGRGNIRGVRPGSQPQDAGAGRSTKTLHSHCAAKCATCTDEGGASLAQLCNSPGAKVPAGSAQLSARSAGKVAGEPGVRIPRGGQRRSRAPALDARRLGLVASEQSAERWARETALNVDLPRLGTPDLSGVHDHHSVCHALSVGPGRAGGHRTKVPTSAVNVHTRGFPGGAYCPLLVSARAGSLDPPDRC